MPENQLYLPEGLQEQPPLSLSKLHKAMEHAEILSGIVQYCDAQHNLHVPLGSVNGFIPREEVNAPWINGANRDIAILSRVGKQICFTVNSMGTDEKGAPIALLSRRDAQEQTLRFFLEHLRPGSVLQACVTHLESFGAFLDIGCGVVALLPIEQISISRISHANERFQTGQKILAAVRSIDPTACRFTMTHKELLGTWMENASWFRPGETVQGIVRSVKSYGSFIELTPNLSGLSDAQPGLVSGDRVSVYIKSIRPERMKIKLQVIEQLPPCDTVPPLRYQITDGHLEQWTYSPPNYERSPIGTDFTSL